MAAYSSLLRHATLVLLPLPGLYTVLLIGAFDWLAYCAALSWVLFIYLVWRCEQGFFAVAIGMLLGQFAATVSNAHIESGGYILEQFTFGYPTGSTVRLVMYNALFFVSALWTYNLVKHLFPINASRPSGFSRAERLIRLAIYVSAGLLFAVLLFALFAFGSPLLQELSRFEYFDNYPLIKSLAAKLPILAFACGIVAAHYRGRHALATRYMLAGIILMNILTGDKFSGIILAIFMYLMPIMVVQAQRRVTSLFTFGRITLASVVMVFLLMLIIYHYSRTYGFDASAAAQFVFDRMFGLQGHVWWGIDQINLRKQQIVGTDLSTLFVPSGDVRDSGVNVLMYAVSPASLVTSYISSGVRFTSGNPAIGLYTLGSLGLLFYQLLTGILFGLLSYYLVRHISLRQIARALIMAMIYIILLDPLAMGEWYIVFTSYFLKYVVLIVLISFFVALKLRGPYGLKPLDLAQATIQSRLPVAGSNVNVR
ncbi:MAG: hypothetical protein A3H35_11940 [Betaproteobacteria bacterium RIFCSPLOWO2_02_FULL_62_17]|nr:MAG: hypothetical protein A3H35_11940 [Betaproteobacteria bacterium RIFCSPLOWO2_02_FULL_62_17]